MQFNRSLKHLISLGLLLTSTSACLLIAAQTSPAIAKGGKIVYSSDRDPERWGQLTEIYVVNEDGSGKTMLTNNFGLDISPDWSPDGSKIAFASSGDDGFGIYVMNESGGDLNRLKDSPGWNSHPDWSLDGSRIVFMSDRNYNFEIYVMNSDGSGQTRLTTDPAHDREPSWSPDGSKIAFHSSRDGNNEIYIMNSDGSGQTRLTDNSAHNQEPDWSPDGSKIAFASTGGGGGYDIYVMNPDGSEQTKLTNEPYLTGSRYPDWSPDGSKIAYSRSPGYSSGEINIMNSDGSGTKNLTKHPYYESNDIAPSWHPVIHQDQPSQQGQPEPMPSDPGVTDPGVEVKDTLLFKLANPKLKRSKTKNIQRKTLYRYLRRGFQGELSGYTDLRASFVRVVKRRSKRAAGHRRKRKQRCYKVIRKRSSCKRTSVRGIYLDAEGNHKVFAYKPLGKNKRRLKRLSKGRRIRKGLYHLTFKVKPRDGGKYKTFRYRLRVH